MTSHHTVLPVVIFLRMDRVMPTYFAGLLGRNVHISTQLSCNRFPIFVFFVLPSLLLETSNRRLWSQKCYVLHLPLSCHWISTLLIDSIQLLNHLFLRIYYLKWPHHFCRNGNLTLTSSRAVRISRANLTNISATDCCIHVDSVNWDFLFALFVALL